MADLERRTREAGVQVDAVRQRLAQLDSRDIFVEAGIVDEVERVRYGDPRLVALHTQYRMMPTLVNWPMSWPLPVLRYVVFQVRQI